MEEIAIIGTGPAGLTAAIYTARAGLKPVVVSGTLPGGQLTQTTEIENYPGFVHGINGFELMTQMQQQAERFGARIVYDTVESVEFHAGGPHQIKLGNETLEAKAVIIATGAAPRWLNLPSEEKLKNRGVSSCATCDGAFFRDVPIVVVGGGDTALEEATYLTRFGSKVMLVHRRHEFRASKAMQERVFKTPKLEVIWDSVVEEVLGEDNVTGVRLKNIKTGAVTPVECSALFVAIGHVPNTAAFQGQVEIDAEGYIVRTGHGSATSVEGVFVAGDCADHVYRQAITAAGMGCQAAIDAERWLASQQV